MGINKGIGLCLALFIVASSCVSAFQIKYYGTYNDSRIEYKQSLFNIPEKYFKGIVAIRYHSNYYLLGNDTYADGTYLIGGVIDIWGGGSFDDARLIMHELAHHCQMVRHDTYYNGINHKGMFNDCQSEIQNASNLYKL